MILALRLGRTLGELMDAIDTHELSLWREFNRQSPLGDERADLLAASLAAVVAQAAGARSASRTCWCAGTPTMRSRPPGGRRRIEGVPAVEGQQGVLMTCPARRVRAGGGTMMCGKS